MLFSLINASVPPERGGAESRIRTSGGLDGAEEAQDGTQDSSPGVPAQRMIPSNRRELRAGAERIMGGDSVCFQGQRSVRQEGRTREKKPSHYLCLFRSFIALL